MKTKKVGMDRELTDKEKTEHRKRNDQSDHSGSFKISHRVILTWSILMAFLVIPPLIDHGINSLLKTVNQNIDVDLPADRVMDNESVLRVYTARTWGAKGIFAVHSWIAMKRRGEKRFEVNQVIGWRQRNNGNVVFRETNVPIDSWWGKEATLVLELRGDQVEPIIEKVDAAISAYPWSREYTLFPGPNSNTFVAWIGLQVPELGLDLPSTAIGKDWRPPEQSLGTSASGSGFQASLFGLLGTSIGYEEGLEINLLGLNFELDLFDLAFEIPLFGRFQIWYLLVYLVIWIYARKWINRTKPKYLHL